MYPRGLPYHPFRMGLTMSMHGFQIGDKVYDHRSATPMELIVIGFVGDDIIDTQIGDTFHGLRVHTPYHYNHLRHVPSEGIPLIFVSPATEDVDVKTLAASILTNKAKRLHKDNTEKGWWDDKDNPLIVPTKLMLTVSEIAEAMEGDRKNLQDDHLPQYTMLECEIADAMIRLLDLAGFLQSDIGQVIEDKLAYNRKRADHTRENRAKEGGKKY